MENVKEIIYNKLNDIVEIVPTIKIEYKYIGATNDHFIKVYPCNDFKSNEVYLEKETDVLLEFAENYPYESLVFLTENDNLDIEYPEKVFIGKMYNSSINIKTFSNLITKNSVIDFFNDSFFGSFIENSCDDVCCEDETCIVENNFSIAA